jgi:hypothetical protein
LARKMSAMNIKEIEMRVAALKATADSDGAKNTSGLWIILHENTKAKNTFSDAIPLRELLGVSENEKVQQFGPRWRGKFTRQSGIGRGFIHRELSGCTFVSVEDTFAGNNVPNRTNYIRRGDSKVDAIDYFIKKNVC